MNIAQSRRIAQKRVTGGRWRRIVLGHVLAEQVIVLTHYDYTYYEMRTLS